jgi:hypothetical protein
MLVFVEARNDTGIPSEAQLQQVRDWYDGTTDDVVRIPPHYEGFLPDGVTPRFIVQACTAPSFSQRVTGMLPDTDVTRELIATDLVNWYAGRKPYVRGASAIDTGLITQKALVSLMQRRVDSGDLQDFTNIEFAPTDTSFVPLDKYALGQGELPATSDSLIVWTS